MKNLVKKSLIFTFVVICAGLVFWRFGFFEKAINFVYKPPLEDSLDDPFELGQYYFNHGPFADGTYDLKKARQYYVEEIENDPRINNLVWYQLGRIDFLEGNFLAAIYRFKKQIEYFDDEVPNVYYMIGLTYGYKARRGGTENDWKEAEKNFLKYIEFDQESPWPRVDLAWIYFSQGKFEEMVPLLEKGLKYHPDNPWLLNMYGLALLNTGHKEDAKKEFLLAKEQAEFITAEEWGRTYPGNDPGIWQSGLDEFKSLIDRNIEIASN